MDNSTADLPDPFVEDPGLRGLIDTNAKDGHWLWLGDVDDEGYGVVYREGYNWRAHRWVWFLVHGFTELPVDHVCRTRLCVRAPSLDHLEAVTTRVNNERIPTWGGNQTHCQQGHPFDDENTISRADGKRRCRTCHREQERRRRARKRSI